MSTSRSGANNDIVSDAVNDEETVLRFSSSQREESATADNRNVSSGSDEVYTKKENQRGLLLIFNHEKYADQLDLKDRIGTQLDKQSLKNCFAYYNFEIRNIKDDMTEAEIMNILREVAMEDHSNRDCLVVVVMTHGKSKGYLAAFDKWYEAEKLLTYFIDNNCHRTLTGKPKLIFIQACRGKEASTAVVPDSPPSTGYSIPAEADILVHYSSYEDKVAYRDEMRGTWFISALCDELKDNGRKDDLLTMLTRVNFKVAKQSYHNGTVKKQMPVIQSCLTKKYYLSNSAECQETDSGSKSYELTRKMDQSIQEPRKKIKKEILSTKDKEKQVVINFDIHNL